MGSCWITEDTNTKMAAVLTEFVFIGNAIDVYSLKVNEITTLYNVFELYQNIHKTVLNGIIDI